MRTNTDCKDHGACPSLALEQAEIDKAKGNINSDWVLLGGEPQKLARDFEFDTYKDGVDFANQVAEIAEELNHHPDIFLGFKKVRVEYYTHNAGGLTHMDFAAAARIDVIASVSDAIQKEKGL